MFNSIAIDIKTMQTTKTTMCHSAEVLDSLLESYFPSTDQEYTHQTVTEHNTNDRRRQSENSENNSRKPDYIVLKGRLGADRTSKAHDRPPRPVDQGQTSTARPPSQQTTLDLAAPTATTGS